MANQGAARFYKRLCGIKSPNRKPPESTAIEYIERLSKWHLTQAEWDAALTLIEQDAALREGLPQLAEIYTFLKRAEIKAGPTDGVIWQTFDRDGLHYARKIPDAMNPSQLPDGATNSRTHLPPQLEWNRERR